MKYYLTILAGLPRVAAGAFLGLGLLASSIALAPPARAQGGAANPAVIVIVDVQAVFRDSKAGKAVTDQTNKFVQALEVVAKKEGEKLQAEAQKLESQRSLLTAEVLQQKAGDFQKKYAKSQQEVGLKMEGIKVGAAKAQQQITRALDPIFAEMMKLKSATMLVERSYIIRGGIDEDITAEVIKRLDQRLPTIKVVPEEVKLKEQG